MKYFVSVLVYFALLSLLDTVFGGVCPPATHIIPCRCTNTSIDCSTDKDLDLKLVFEAIAHGKEPNSEDLKFETFILNNSVINKLEDNVFRGVTFETIKFLNCNKLTCISPLAFNGQQKNLTTFISDGCSLQSDDKNCNVFEALKMLYNLETIVITQSQIKEIPANAFDGELDPLKALRSINFNGGQRGEITRVGKRAFSTLRGLEYLDLSYNKINKVDSFGFAFIDPIQHKLVIDLTHNNLTENSFGIEAFEVNERITELRLKANPRLLVLSEKVFQPFLINRLNETDHNIIDLSGTPIQCKPENLWLLEMVSSLRLNDKLKNVLSTDGDSFWRHTRKECANAKRMVLSNLK